MYLMRFSTQPHNITLPTTNTCYSTNMSTLERRLRKNQHIYTVISSLELNIPQNSSVRTDDLGRNRDTGRSKTESQHYLCA